MDFLPGELRLVRRDGIRLFNIHHWDNVLIPMSCHFRKLCPHTRTLWLENWSRIETSLKRLNPKSANAS